MHAMVFGDSHSGFLRVQRSSGNLDSMAPSVLILITLFALATVLGMIEARTARASESKNVAGVDVKEAAVVAKAIENLMHGGESTSFSGENTARDCHTSSNYNQNNGKVFVRDFERRPDVTAYPDDAKITDYLTTFKKDFEPRPDVTAYPDNAKLEDFELRPTDSPYLNKDAHKT